jgi:glutathione S-transferase kappa 1
MQKALTPENKKRVVELTTGAKAFGAPWISAVNSDGERRDYFGNDRWDHVFEHLGVPYTPVGIVAPQQAKSKI